MLWKLYYNFLFNYFISLSADLSICMQTLNRGDLPWKNLVASATCSED